MSTNKRIVKTDKAPAPIGPYNQAVWAGDMLFCSGQIAIDPATAELKIDDLETETRLVMSNIKAILTHEGLTMDHIVKTSIFLSDMGLFGQVNAIYGEYFSEGQAPARECVAVKTLPKNVNVEITVIATK